MTTGNDNHSTHHEAPPRLSSAPDTTSPAGARSLTDQDWDDPTDARTPAVAPIDWDSLTPAELRDAWLELDAFVTRLRHTYNLPATVIPPLWHRHPELHMELSALHLAWQAAHAPDAHPTAPLTWHRDLGDAISRLRDWTAQTGSRLDHDPGRQLTLWPGEADEPAVPRSITNRAADFQEHVDLVSRDRRWE